VKRAIAWFAENHVAANLLMVLIVAGGIAALPAIEQRTFPEFEIDIIQVGVTYLGAAPEEVEEGVCVRIEEEVSNIEGIDRITSTATEGACGVTLEILSGYPIDRALSEIKNAVDGISTFPEETEKPVVSHLSLRSVELQIALSGRVPEPTLKFYGEKLRDDITAATDVTQAELSSARDYEISIEVPEQSLRRHGLTFGQVVEAVRRSSLDLPGGSLKTEGGEILLRAKGQAYTGEQFERIVVHTRDDGTRLLLSEIANVVDGFEEDPRFASFDGEPAVMVQIFRVGDQKVLDLVAQVKEYLAGAVERLPDGIHATVWRDGSQYLRDRLSILIRNGLGGFLLVFALLALFLRLRLAFWVAIGIPISFMGALWLFPILDVSIDVLSLFAFILVLGILVDDAIVVGENVHSHQELSEEPLGAAIRGAQEVSVPVIFGVLTSVAAFLPMIVSPGRIGMLFGTIGVVVLCCLFFSLVESQWVLPAHLGHLGAARRERPARKGSLRARWKVLQARLAGSLTGFARNRYRPALEHALHWRYASVAGGIALLMVATAVVASGRLPFTFFPMIESDYVTASITLPQGSPYEATEAAVATLERSLHHAQAEIEAELGVAPGSLVKHVLASVGEQPSLRGGPPAPDGGSASHLGQVSVELGDGNERPLSSREITDRWRAATPPLPDVEELIFNSQYMSVGSPIDVELRSADTRQLEHAAQRLKEHLTSYPGVFDVADSFLAGKEEIELAILPSAQTLGLTLDDLARQVRQAFYGEEVQRIQRGRDDVRVMVRYPQSQRRSLADLDGLHIRTPDGAEVPFYAVAKAERGRGFANIKRANRQRVVDVTADVDPEVSSANRVLSELERNFLPRLLAEHPGLSYGLEGEQREQRKTVTALVRNYGFALVLIYALLAVPLRSYGQPLLIMAVIPFGLVGAIAGHLIMRIGLSMMSVFGAVALSGVVVNASLVLVHRVNELRSGGVPLEQAVRDAGIARFRPIVLTSLTTFAGLTPLLLEQAMGAQFLIPMATSLAFGVAFATVISLFLVPCGYLILEDLIALRRGPSAPAAADESERGTVVELGRRR
jgi:multidrug efflux pump subunit AcrB